jgi:hypothetical protein
MLVVASSRIARRGGKLIGSLHWSACAIMGGSMEMWLLFSESGMILAIRFQRTEFSMCGAGG